MPMLVLARRNVARASARSVLAVAAIVIGVVAIGAIGISGEAFKQDQLAAYEGFGGTATVSPVYDPSGSGTAEQAFSDDDIARMRQAAGDATVLPVVEPDRSSASVRVPNGEPIPTASVQSLAGLGRFYDADKGAIPADWERTAIVGARVANENDIVVGDRIVVDVDGEFRREFRVVAILQSQGFAGPLNADRSVFVPPEQFDTETYDSAVVQADPQSTSVDRVGDRIESEFNRRERTVSVRPVQEQREQFAEFFETINRLLIGVSAISLVVAAVTIGNTMLMSVVEREGEIGVLRAVGYPKSAVVRLIVAEATILGVIGVAVGIPLSLGLGAAANALLVGDPLSFTPMGLQYVAAGTGFGILTSMLAGVYPAWKAANKRPTEVLD